MTSICLSIAIFSCMCLSWMVALPTQPALNSGSSGAGEIPEELPLENRPFDGILGKGSLDNSYDLDSDEGRFFPEYDVNYIPHRRPEDDISEGPYDRIPEDRHPEDKSKEEPEEVEDHELPSQKKPKGGEKSHDDEEEKTEIPMVEDDKPHLSKEEDPHAVEDEMKPHEDIDEDTHAVGDEIKPHEGKDVDMHAVEDEMKPHEGKEEDTHVEENVQKPLEGEEGKPQEEIGLPLKPSLFSFQQVNHYIKQLEKAMDNAFKNSLEEASSLNNTFANTTDEEVEVNGHKYKVHKSIIKTGDEDSNSTLFIEAVSSVNEDEPKNRNERSNPDAEPNQ